MSGDDNYLKRLEDLAAAKTAAAADAAGKEATLFRRRLDKVTDLSDEGPFAQGLNTLINRLIPSDWRIDTGPRSPSAMRQSLIQFLQLRQCFSCDTWEVVAEPDDTAPDESNVISTKKRYLMDVDYDECDSRDRDISDLLLMFGRLARNIKSSFLPRIIQLIIDMKDACRWNKSNTEQEASRLVDEFITCWKLVMTETELLDPEELLEVWPKRPTHEDQNKYSSLDTTGLDAEEATDASRERAWEIYCRENKDIMLSANASKGSAHPLSYLASFVTDIADKMERGEPSTDARWRKLDYDTLARVLSANTLFSYDGYEMDEETEELVEVNCTEPTPENKYKKQIIKDLDRYLDAACLLAKKIGSKSYDDFAECQARFAAHNGDFHGYLDHEKLIAAKDLNILITRLKRARPVLWVDNANYKPNDTPLPARVVDVSKEGAKSLRTALKDPGGRPAKTEGGAKVLSQGEMAVAFGEPCNEAMVANWEARAAGKKRGANPPDAVYNGLKIIYSAELRTNPTPDNKKRLTALIAEFQSRHRLKAAIGEKAKTIHCRSAESLYQAQKKHGA